MWYLDGDALGDDAVLPVRLACVLERHPNGDTAFSARLRDAFEGWYDAQPVSHKVRALVDGRPSLAFHMGEWVRESLAIDRAAFAERLGLDWDGEDDDTIQNICSVHVASGWSPLLGGVSLCGRILLRTDEGAFALDLDDALTLRDWLDRMAGRLGDGSDERRRYLNDPPTHGHA